MVQDTSNLSSNWKELQKQLKQQQPTHKTSSATSSNKRKGTDPFQPERAKVAKKQKQGLHHISVSSQPDGKPKSRAMGATLSQFGTNANHDANEANNDLPRDAPKNSKRPNVNQQMTSTEDLESSGKLGKYVSLDTEMVGTLNPPPFSLPPSRHPPHTSSILARASLVSYTGDVLYDAYVLPPAPAKPIADYRTQWSGITPWHLNPKNPVTCPKDFETVQKEVADLIEGRVLIGHDVKNDLTVLGLGHPVSCIRDTAKHPRFRIRTTVQAGRRDGGEGRAQNNVIGNKGGGRVKGKKPSLKALAEEVLGLEIQSDEKKGHSSVEDAKAVMALFRQEKVHFERMAHDKFGKSAGGGVKGKNSPLSLSKVHTSNATEHGEPEDREQDNKSGTESISSLGDQPRRSHRTQAKKKRNKKGKKRTKRKY